MYICSHYVALPEQYEDLEPALYSIGQIIANEARQAARQVEENMYAQVETRVAISSSETKQTLKVIFHEMLDELDPGMPMEEFDRIFDRRFSEEVVLP